MWSTNPSQRSGLHERFTSFRTQIQYSSPPAGYIPCQEEGNVSYVLDNGVGAYSEDPSEIANVVARWFDTASLDLQTMSAKAKLLGRPQATFDIVRELTGRFLLHSPSLYETSDRRFHTRPQKWFPSKVTTLEDHTGKVVLALLRTTIAARNEYLSLVVAEVKDRN